MATTWEKVLDDFNNRFRPFVIDYVDYKIKNPINENGGYQPYMLIPNIDLFNKLFFIDFETLKRDTHYGNIYNNILNFIEELNNNYEYIDSKFIQLSFGHGRHNGGRTYGSGFCIHLILYNKLTQKIVNINNNVQISEKGDGVYYSGYYILNMSYNLNNDELYDGKIYFDDKFFDYISPMKNLDIVIFKLKDGFIYNNFKDGRYVEEARYINIDCNKDYINDPYIATFQLIESIDNSTSGGRNQTLVENAYNEGFERGYNEGVYNTKKQFTETKKQFDSLFNY